VRQFLETNLIRPKDRDQPMQWRIPLAWLTQSLDLMGDFPFRNPEEARFEGPTLMVRGSDSPYVADEALPTIGRFFPRFELADIKSGHWVISENPKEFERGMSNLHCLFAEANPPQSLSSFFEIRNKETPIGSLREH
jgi:pimeloyl-ACP methyl ester carboxylesterase